MHRSTSPVRPARAWSRAMVGLAATALLVSACASDDGGTEPATGNTGETGGTALSWPTEQLRIMAPAAPGGGWDQTSRALQEVIDSEGLAPDGVEVFNVEGAGGTIGLSQLAGENSESIVMTMGLVMVGAIRTNDSPRTLEDVTPIARLTAEQEVIVVPADSPYQTLADFTDALLEDPGSVAIAGGSAGGTDNILAGLIAQDIGADPAAINYIAYSGGGESLAALLGGQVAAGISGVAEYAGQVEEGALRALAVSGSEPSSQLPDVQTLTEQGVNVELLNWRGIVAPPDIDEETVAAMVDFFTQVNESQAWQDVVETNGWENTFLTGDEFATFIDEETTRIEGVLADIGLIEG